MFAREGEWIAAGELFDTTMEARTGTLNEQLACTEAALIRQALARHNGNRSETAQALGIDRTTLGRKMDRYGIP